MMLSKYASWFFYDFDPQAEHQVKYTYCRCQQKGMTHFYWLTLECSKEWPRAILQGQLEWEVGLTCFVRKSNIFLVLAECTAEVQTGLHQSLPGKTARAGTTGAGEEGAGRFWGPSVRRCCRAEESPQWPLYLSERYSTTLTSFISCTAYCHAAAATS